MQPFLRPSYRRMCPVLRCSPIPIPLSLTQRETGAVLQRGCSQSGLPRWSVSLRAAARMEPWVPSAVCPSCPHPVCPSPSRCCPVHPVCPSRQSLVPPPGVAVGRGGAAEGGAGAGRGRREEPEGAGCARGAPEEPEGPGEAPGSPEEPGAGVGAAPSAGPCRRARPVLPQPRGAGLCRRGNDNQRGQDSVPHDVCL